MGSFRDVVRSRRGPSGRINEFKLGFALDAQSDLSYRELAATFQESGFQPILSSLRFGFSADWYLELQRTESGESVMEMPSCPTAEIDFPFEEVGFLLHLLNNDKPHLLHQFEGLKPILDRLSGLGLGLGERRRRHAKQRDGLALPLLPELMPVAPLRSKPKRTYDPVRETASPEGEHIPC